MSRIILADQPLKYFQIEDIDPQELDFHLMSRQMEIDYELVARIDGVQRTLLTANRDGSTTHGPEFYFKWNYEAGSPFSRSALTLEFPNGRGYPKKKVIFRAEFSYPPYAASGMSAGTGILISDYPEITHTVTVNRGLLSVRASCDDPKAFL